MEKNYNDINDSEQIRKYLNGELSPQQMQALEKAALEDPMLDDALTGYEENPKSLRSLDADKQDLLGRLEKRAEPVRKPAAVAYIFKLAVAASVFFAVGLSLFMIGQVNHKGKDISRLNARDTGYTGERLTPLPSEAETKEDKPKKRIRRTSERYAPASDISNLPEKDLLNHKQPMREKAADTVYRFSPQTEAVANSSTQPPAAAPSGLSAADAASRKRSAPETSGSSSNSVEMDPIEKPTGWEVFYNYIMTHKKVTGPDSVWKGNEKLSFMLKKNGEISEIEILNSLSPSHDEEIKRLVRMAPAIQPVSGKKQKVQLSIPFR